MSDHVVDTENIVWKGKLEGDVIRLTAPLLHGRART